MYQHKGLVDTHYAGYSAQGFVRGISRKNLLAIASRKSIDIILLDLDVDTLFERRTRDILSKRSLDKEHMQKELVANRAYFEQYCKDLLISGLVVLNYDTENSMSKILKRIK